MKTRAELEAAATVLRAAIDKTVADSENIGPVRAFAAVGVFGTSLVAIEWVLGDDDGGLAKTLGELTRIQHGGTNDDRAE